jgi:hypothetical protein
MPANHRANMPPACSREEARCGRCDSDRTAQTANPPGPRDAGARKRRARGACSWRGILAWHTGVAGQSVGTSLPSRVPASSPSAQVCRSSEVSTRWREMASTSTAQPAVPTGFRLRFRAVTEPLPRSAVARTATARAVVAVVHGSTHVDGHARGVEVDGWRHVTSRGSMAVWRTRSSRRRRGVVRRRRVTQVRRGRGRRAIR